MHGLTRNYLLLLTLISLFFILKQQQVKAQTNPNHPNILLIISDDLGVDQTKGYHQNSLMANTPNLDSLRRNGVTFKNAWSTPVCTPTRAAIMSGKYGIHTGVVNVPGNLDLAHTSIFSEIETETGNIYGDAVIGKWHISQPKDENHPAQHGVDFYSGIFEGQVDDYYRWVRTEQGDTMTQADYVTNHLTDKAIDWVKEQNKPWFLWLAHVAPHVPVHLPPDSMYTLGATGSNYRKFLTMIEAMDYSIGRLIDSIPQNVLDNTLIIYLGDNGTQQSFSENYPPNHDKGTLYQGGIHVPFIVSGKGVTRKNEKEEALVHVADVYATALEVAGVSLADHKIHNSLSFKHLLSNDAGPIRTYNYSEIVSVDVNGWTIRDCQYKLIEFSGGRQEFYDLLIDSLETNNLLESSLSAGQLDIKNELEEAAFQIRAEAASCDDGIQNGEEEGIDCGGSNCVACGSITCNHDNSTYTTNIGCCEVPSSPSIYYEIVYNDNRTISVNDYPNHEFCYTANRIPSPKNYLFEIDAMPTLAAAPTSVLTVNNRPDYYYGIALNGVLIAPAPAQPFIFENQTTGEYNWDWVFEPTNNQGSGANRVGLDCASGHTGEQGYHYHGNMFEYVEGLQSGISIETMPPIEPLQVGWAADGFPILYRFGPDGLGGQTLLQPSYQLKTGDRLGNGITAPCGPYNGKYTNDYEYVIGAGDLDECNGIQRMLTLNTVCGLQTFDYFYMVTDSFPQIGRCFSGKPHQSFNNSNKGATCLTSLISQEITLSNGQTYTVGNNTYDQTGIYQDSLINASACDSIVVTKITIATCNDGIQNGDEDGVDCGGSSCTACPTCNDGIQNGDEESVDCGGLVCSACPTCNDGIQNGEEEGVDCGGLVCPACPTCNDGIQNGDEESVDCGGLVCTACPTCNDGIQNGEEEGVDCGGLVCIACNPPNFEARVFFYGAYQQAGTGMTTLLREENLIPINQPFNRSPWNYNGVEISNNIPANVTDWVLVEVRDAGDARNCCIEQQACFVNSDGYLMNLEGTLGIHLASVSSQTDYMVLIRSRHHLAIMSEQTIQFPVAIPYDFTLWTNVMGGRRQLTETVDGNYAMKAGDINSNGVISVEDFNQYQSELANNNTPNYLEADINLDGRVNVDDYNLYQGNSSAIGIRFVRY